jgi:cell division protein FtsZ
MIELPSELKELRPRISVIGVGGAGGNAVESMIRGDSLGIDFVVANTDAQALRASNADTVIQLGRKTTAGLGAGSSADLGRAAAEESLPAIEAMLSGTHMCFITAGLGGGTGTGAAPVIARVARDLGILTVGVVTKPFRFEGRRRARAAEIGLEELQKHVDTLIVIPNQNLFRVADAGTTFKAAFDLADRVLRQGVHGITDLMTMPGLINLDFADIRTVMGNMGRAVLGTGEASGEDRAIRAADEAISNPLLDEALQGARGLLISITGGDDLRLMEVDEIAAYIKDMVDPDADIIWGSSVSAEYDGRIRVAIVATGIAGPAAPETAVPDLSALIAAPAPAAAPPRPVAIGKTEARLTLRRPLVLVPPETEVDIPMVDLFAPAAPPIRKPSLYERMATASQPPAGRRREPALLHSL